MKIKIALWIVSIISVFFFHPSSLYAQGSLTPPGAPTTTMKSLDQIEARTPISSALFAITAPGSYYLTANVSVAGGNAIFISANQVTLDLNGFTISSTNPRQLGFRHLIERLQYRRYHILNGHITSGVTDNAGTFSGPGFINGISVYGPGTFSNIRVTGVSVSSCLNDGILVGGASSTVVESCTVQNVGGVGIEANVITHCSASSCGNTAIDAVIASDCYGQCVGSTGDGIAANNTANNCTGLSVGGFGVSINEGCAINCNGQSSTGDGVSVGTGVANNCSGQSASGNGVYVNEGTINNCCGSSFSGDGIIVSGAVNQISPGCTANNCFGYSANGDGIHCDVGVVNNSFGQSGGSGSGVIGGLISMASLGISVTGTGFQGDISTGCFGISAYGTSESVVNKYNMP